MRLRPCGDFFSRPLAHRSMATNLRRLPPLPDSLGELPRLELVVALLCRSKEWAAALPVLMSGPVEALTHDRLSFENVITLMNAS